MQACANVTVDNHGGQRQNDRCVWVKMSSDNVSCQHWGDIPCSERGQVYQTNATLCNAIKSYGNSCRVSRTADQCCADTERVAIESLKQLPSGWSYRHCILTVP